MVISRNRIIDIRKKKKKTVTRVEEKRKDGDYKDGGSGVDFVAVRGFKQRDRETSVPGCSLRI